MHLDVMSNKETRRQYSTDDKRHIYAEIIARNGTSKRLKHGVSKAVAVACICPRRIVQRVWQEAKKRRRHYWGQKQSEAQIRKEED